VAGRPAGGEKMTNYTPKNLGAPSILGDVPPPFSTQTTHGSSAAFDDLYPQWKSGRTPEINTQIVKSLQPIIDTAVTSYAGQNASPNVRSKARLMALKALDTYDPTRGNVKTHLLSQMQSLRRLSAKEQNIISIPEQVAFDHRRLNDAENELLDSFGRPATDIELADMTGLSTRRIKKIRAFNQPISEGMTAARTGDSDDATNTEIASVLPNYTKHTDAWLDFVHDDLSPTDQLIMDMTLGRNGRRRVSTQEIANKLRITPGAVSQRAAKIQDMIDQRYKHNF
jgi:DNA-directed RNA polymerase specialized sigma subunit